LHLALIVAGVAPDDEVLVSDLTFIAPANAIRYVGAWPVLVDAEARHWQMDVEAVSQFLSQNCIRTGGKVVNRSSGRTVSAIVPVHVLGHPVDMTPLLDLAAEFGLKVIEDATESLGARYKGQALGGIGQLGCLSFNGNKLLTTGSGGMLVTNDPELAQRARYLSTQAKDDPIRYIHNEIGYNYRLSNIHAAVGVAQMEQLIDFVARKHAIAGRYQQGLSDIPGLSALEASEHSDCSWWLYTILVDPESYGHSNMELLEKLAQEGIQARPLWQPLHLNTPYRNAERIGKGHGLGLYERALSIPSSVQLDTADQDRVINAIRQYARRNR
jgi:perosamine synthetase